jgi:TolB protein
VERYTSRGAGKVQYPLSDRGTFGVISVSRTLLLAAGAGCVASAASAQRQTILPQIKVPHNYYYREMYLPQVTSGPSSVAWSPDGRELIYSMQGSLWRQRIGSTAARQLTAASGYDFQPDWSPDGKQVVYAFYSGRAIDLRLLDLESGQSRTILANGAVNVEPRWSPDGRRLAFVSSAYEGRWHIFVASFDSAGILQPPERITRDTLSGLPRYYYDVHDQYLHLQSRPRLGLRRFLAHGREGRRRAARASL